MLRLQSQYLDQQLGFAILAYCSSPLTEFYPTRHHASKNQQKQVKNISYANYNELRPFPSMHSFLSCSLLILFPFTYCQTSRFICGSQNVNFVLLSHLAQWKLRFT